MTSEDNKLPTFTALLLAKLNFISAVYKGWSKVARDFKIEPRKLRYWKTGAVSKEGLAKIDEMYSIAWERRQMYVNRLKRERENRRKNNLQNSVDGRA